MKEQTKFMVFLNGKRLPCASAQIKTYTVFPKKLSKPIKTTMVVRIWTKKNR